MSNKQTATSQTTATIPNTTATSSSCFSGLPSTFTECKASRKGLLIINALTHNPSAPLLPTAWLLFLLLMSLIVSKNAIAIIFLDTPSPASVGLHLVVPFSSLKQSPLVPRISVCPLYSNPHLFSSCLPGPCFSASIPSPALSVFAALPPGPPSWCPTLLTQPQDGAQCFPASPPSPKPASLALPDLSNSAPPRYHTCQLPAAKLLFKMGDSITRHPDCRARHLNPGCSPLFQSHSNPSPRCLALPAEPLFQPSTWIHSHHLSPGQLGALLSRPLALPSVLQRDHSKCKCCLCTPLLRFLPWLPVAPVIKSQLLTRTSKPCTNCSSLASVHLSPLPPQLQTQPDSSFTFQMVPVSLTGRPLYIPFPLPGTPSPLLRANSHHAQHKHPLLKTSLP